LKDGLIDRIIDSSVNQLQLISSVIMLRLKTTVKMTKTCSRDENIGFLTEFDEAY